MNTIDTIEGLIRRANEGDPEAQYKLGWRYAAGRNVTQNDKEGVKWLRKAAEQGHTKSQNILGMMYSIGHGVRQDYVEGVKWLRKAAEQGLAQAQHDLGTMYAIGNGEFVEGVKWLRKAAEQGLAQAQHDLGTMYANGHGVPQDYVESHLWWNLAAAQGNEEARQKRDIVAKMLTASQVVDAQCRAREKMEEIRDE